jgi:hypothetical protein
MLSGYSGPSAPRGTLPVLTAIKEYLVRGVIRCVVAATGPNYLVSKEQICALEEQWRSELKIDVLLLTPSV